MVMHVRHLWRDPWRALASACALALALAAGSGLKTATGAIEELRAELDPEVIVLGESVVLTIIASGRNLAAQPDLAPLQEDFDVVSRAQSERLILSAGSPSAEIRWQFVLMPKRAGSLRVPPIPVGDRRTPALGLEVEEPSDASAPDYRLEVTAEPTDPYVQQQVTYRIRLFLARELRVRDGSIAPPGGDDLRVERIGEDRETATVRDGRSYRVIERRYAIFPEYSGTVTIDGVIFSGRVVSPSTDRNTVFHSARPVRQRADALTLEVRPKPAQFPGDWWLPARDVTLEETWNPPTARVPLGEPITRTVTLTASDLTDPQLPAIPAPTNGAWRVYRDQPKRGTRTFDGTLRAERQEAQALIPNALGMTTIPGIRIHWWDTEANRARVAELPDRQVEVFDPNGRASGASPPESQVSPRPPDGAGATQGEQPPAADAGAPAQADGDRVPSWLAWIPGAAPGSTLGHSKPWVFSTIALAIIWLVTLAWALSRTPRVEPVDASEQRVAQERLSRIRTRLREAWQQGEAGAARDELLNWARAVNAMAGSPQGATGLLGQVASMVHDHAVREAIAMLDATLYDESRRDDLVLAATWNTHVPWSRLARALTEAQHLATQAPQGGSERPHGLKRLAPETPHQAPSA